MRESEKKLRSGVGEVENSGRQLGAGREEEGKQIQQEAQGADQGEEATGCRGG